MNLNNLVKILDDTGPTNTGILIMIVPSPGIVPLVTQYK